MSILKLANAFNLLAQQSQANGGLNGYHMGAGVSESNYNHENNFNIENLDGDQYPFLLAILPDGDFNPKQNNAINYTFDLYFYDTQWRDNEGTPDQRGTTDVLKLSNLEAVAHEFVRNFYNIGANKLLNGVAFSITNAPFKTATMATTNRHLVYNVTLSVAFTSYECPTWNFLAANVPPDYDLTDINTVDYEAIKPA